VLAAVSIRSQKGVLATAFPDVLGLGVARKARFPRGTSATQRRWAERSPAGCSGSTTSSGMASDGAFHNLLLLAVLLCLALTSSVCTLNTLFAAV